jgi:hypothetical protein
MSFSAVTYAVSKHYTDETAIQFGGLKGAPCKIKSITKKDGQNTIIFEWTNDDGETRESTLIVEDGTPIYQWRPNQRYEYGDLVIYESNFYRCTTPNNDPVFVESHWSAIGSPDGSYGLVNTKDELPARFTTADRKMYYVAEEGIYYLWNGTKWEPQIISNEDIDALFI